MRGLFGEERETESEQQVPVRKDRLGFHWNNTHKCWQHPSGRPLGPRGQQNPREKYATYFSADRHPIDDNTYRYNGPARKAEQVLA